MDEVGALRSGGEPSALHRWRLLAWEGREREALQVSNVREGGRLFRPFWTEDADDRFGDEDMAAVAERFGVVEQNARYIAVYPAYAMVRGPCQQVSVPAMRNQPWWPGQLFPCKSAIEKNLRHLPDVPQLQQEEIEVDLEDSLPLKQKIAPTNHLNCRILLLVLKILLL